MKKICFIIILSLLLSITVSTAMALESVDGTKLVGEHYTLNIIGVQNPKTADMSGGGSVIFVNIEGNNKITLIEGDDFAVLDKNATDGEAVFQLPDPGLDPYIVGDEKDADTVSDYSVYVRPLGKPGGSATIRTCADVINSNLDDFLSKKLAKEVAAMVTNDPGGFGGYASVEQVGSDITMRTKGKTCFTDVTAELLTIVLRVEIYDMEGMLIAVEYVRVPIFDDILENEYWEYDNDGLKLLQVRFYPWGTDVSAGDGDLPALE